MTILLPIATVLINSMIMTVYLWHMSVIAGVAALLYYLGGWGFGVEPGSASWWYTRPVWIGILMTILLPIATVSWSARLVVPTTHRRQCGRLSEPACCVSVSPCSHYSATGAVR
jgi:hypothetical protein